MRSPFIEVSFLNSSCSKERFERTIKYFKESFTWTQEENECFFETKNLLQCRRKNEEECYQRKKEFLATFESISADLHLVKEFESKIRKKQEKVDVTLEKITFDFSDYLKKSFGVSFSSFCSFSKVRVGNKISFWYELKFMSSELCDKMRNCCEEVFSIINETSFPFCQREKQNLVTFIQENCPNFDFVPLTEQNFNSSYISVAKDVPDQMYLVPKGKKCLLVFFDSWYWICRKESGRWEGINKCCYSSFPQKLPFSNFICFAFEGSFLSSSSSKDLFRQLFLSCVVCLSSSPSKIFYQRGELSIQLAFGNLFSIIDKELSNSGFRTSWINFFSLDSNIVAEVERLYFVSRKDSQIFKGICFSTKTNQIFCSFSSSVILQIVSKQDGFCSCISKDFKTIHDISFANDTETCEVDSFVSVFLSSFSQNKDKKFLVGGIVNKVVNSRQTLSSIRKRNIIFEEISDFSLVSLFCQMKSSKNLFLCCSKKTQKDFCKLFSISSINKFESSLFSFKKEEESLIVAQRNSKRKIEIKIKDVISEDTIENFDFPFFQTPLSFVLGKFCFFAK